MANTASAKKELRKNTKRRSQNAHRIARTEALLRTLKQANHRTKAAISQAQKALHKTVKVGLMHPRKASRLIARLMRRGETER